MEFLHHFFSLVCGQAHNWTLGGQALPFCERCTGLNIGGIYAFLVIVFFRPPRSRLYLSLHGLLLLLMIPFGYHYVSEDSIVRTITGQFFAVGLTYFLLLTPAALITLKKPARIGFGWAYVAFMLIGILCLLVLLEFGGIAVGVILAWIGFAGFVLYAGLFLANLISVPAAIWLTVTGQRT